tara:strand:+ start:783 stop:1184 length:402 start_codon:yes stop_codon:yes gene_type:complete
MSNLNNISFGLGKREYSDGSGYYGQSGLKTGDATLPATITLLDFNTGLTDAEAILTAGFSLPITTAVNEGLGIQVLMDDNIVYEFKSPDPFYRNIPNGINLFLPRQVQFKVLSLNTNGNNGQSRCAIIKAKYI